MVQQRQRETLPWWECGDCGHKNSGSNRCCGGCGVVKTRRSKDLPPRSENKGKGKGKGKTEGENKGKGIGKCPSFRKPQPQSRQLGSCLQAASWPAAGQPAGQRSAPRDGERLAKENADKHLAKENASLQRKLAEAEKNLAAAKAGAAPAVGAEDAAMGGEAAAVWNCSRCSKDHKNAKCTTCRLCGHPRAEATASTEAPASRSPEEVAAERTTLKQRLESLATFGLKPANLAAAKKDIEAQLRLLDEVPAEAAEMTPYERLDQARVASDKAKAHCDYILVQGLEIQARIKNYEQDLDRLTTAMVMAEDVRKQAEAELTEATAALPLTKPSAQAAAAAPAARNAGCATSAEEANANALKKIDAELLQANAEKKEILFEMRAMLTGSAPQGAEPPPPPADPKPVEPPLLPAALLRASETPPLVAGSDGNRLQQRPPLKTAAVDDTPATRFNRVAGGTLLRKERRDSAFASLREGGDASDPEDAKTVT